jgi:hypothetical protein
MLLATRQLTHKPQPVTQRTYMNLNNITLLEGSALADHVADLCIALTVVILFYAVVFC